MTTTGSANDHVSPQDLILAALSTLEVARNEQGWDRLPQMFALYQKDQCAFAAVEVSRGLWWPAGESPEQALTAYAAHASHQRLKLMPHQIAGRFCAAAFLSEAWASVLDLVEIQRDPTLLTRRPADHPGGFELRFLQAVDITGASYCVTRRRGAATPSAHTGAHTAPVCAALAGIHDTLRRLAADWAVTDGPC